MSDTLDRFTTIAAGFTSRIDAVSADAWNNDAPCEGWKARDVATHVINASYHFSGGEPPASIADADLPAAWATARDAIASALADPEKAKAQTQSPFGPMPLEDVIGRLSCTDVLVHTWDLARAAGLDETLHAESVAGAFEGLKPMDAMIRMPGVFGPKIEVGADADLQTQFLSFLGRTV